MIPEQVFAAADFLADHLEWIDSHAGCKVTGSERFVGTVFSTEYGEYVNQTIFGLTPGDLVELTGADALEEGAICQALVFPDWVIKWPKATSHEDRIHRHYKGSSSDRDTYMQSVHQGVAAHFALTQAYRGVTIQERVTPFEECDWQDMMEHFPVKPTDYSPFVQLFTKLANICTLMKIGDMHPANWGFRSGQYETPVIFDFSDCNMHWSSAIRVGCDIVVPNTLPNYQEIRLAVKDAIAQHLSTY